MGAWVRLRAAPDFQIIACMSKSVPRFARTLARLAVVASTGSLCLGAALCGTASAGLSSLQLQGYVPETVSCAPDGSCTTAGSIPKPFGESYTGLMTTVVNGQTKAVVPAVLPANASPTDPWVGFGTEACNFGVGIMCLPTGVVNVPPISNVSCQSAGNCTAVGTYLDTAGNMDGVMLTETDGVWATGVQAEVPASLMNVPAGDNTELRFVSVQCASAGNCTAAANLSVYSFSGRAFPYGSWMAAGGITALAFTENNGTWSAAQVIPPPQDARTQNGYTRVSSLSCPAMGDCVAVGSYGSTSVNTTYVATESSGVWAQGVAVPVPSEPLGSWGLSLDAVACTHVGDCTAVGGLHVVTSQSTEYPEPLAVSETNGVWGSATTINVPANAWPSTAGQIPAGRTSVLDLLACPSTGNCTAAGDYVDANGIPQGLAVNESGGSWLAGVQAQQPANAGIYNTVSLTQLSCANAGDCAATGQETQLLISGPNQISGISAAADTGVLFSETNGIWATGSVPQLPANAAQAATPVVGSISCSTSNGCVAVGTYDALPSASAASAAAVGSATATGGKEPYVVSRASSGWSRAIELTPPTPTRAQLLASIRLVLLADRRATAARGNKRFTGTVRVFTALEAGTITIRWTTRSGRRNVLVAQAMAQIAKATTVKLHIRITKAGTSLLRTGRTIRVIDRVAFNPATAAAVRTSGSFKLTGLRYAHRRKHTHG